MHEVLCSDLWSERRLFKVSNSNSLRFFRVLTPTISTRITTAMLLLSAWSTNGWLPSGHAMRMALDLGLHRALEKLAENSGPTVSGTSHGGGVGNSGAFGGPNTPDSGTSGRRRSEDEERDLGKYPAHHSVTRYRTEAVLKSSPRGFGYAFIGSIISAFLYWTLRTQMLIVHL